MNTFLLYLARMIFEKCVLKFKHLHYFYIVLGRGTSSWSGRRNQSTWMLLIFFPFLFLPFLSFCLFFHHRPPSPLTLILSPVIISQPHSPSSALISSTPHPAPSLTGRQSNSPFSSSLLTLSGFSVPPCSFAYGSGSPPPPGNNN